MLQKIEIVWNKLIFEKYNNKVEIDVEKLKKKINEAESKLNTFALWLRALSRMLSSYKTRTSVLTDAGERLYGSNWMKSSKGSAFDHTSSSIFPTIVGA